MKRIFCFGLMLLCLNALNAQKLPKAAYDILKPLEDSLKQSSIDMNDPDDEFIFRFKADSFFTRGLVNALRVPYSFYYPFDSLSVSKVYAPDSSFRIITWEVMKDFTYYRQKGAIQMNTEDGSLKIIPLFDASDFTGNQVDSVRNANNWIGAVYYNIVEKTYNNKNYYTLIGSDGNGARTKKKWIEVMTFDDKGKPVFGGDYFHYPNDALKPKQPVSRFCMEFKKEANIRLSYDPQLDEIVFDKLYSEEQTPNLRYTLVPYGDYEAFVWRNGVWVYNPNPFEDDGQKKSQDLMKRLQQEDKKKTNTKKPPVVIPVPDKAPPPPPPKEKSKDDNTY